ncbi:MAG TPA: hypothetical protein VMJ10_30735, partial [Kofleriaceae bacterium]|nr:hypothetical protein [Kofleriaceae bacterium]
EAGNTVLRALPDRGRYGLEKMRKLSPHARIIGLMGDHLRDGTEEPTPFDEVDYVIRTGDQIGREIDRKVTAIRGQRS